MSSNKGGYKRKKSYYLASKKRPRLQHSLQPGIKGFLITCNKREREAVTEAYKLLAEYADKMLGPEQSDQEAAPSSDEEDDVDLEAALQKEVATLKSKTTERRFQQVECGANNCVFVKTTIADPASLLHAIFSDLLETGQSKSRHIMRILPVAGTCRTVDESFEKTLPDLLKPFFGEGSPSYCLNFKVRNNNSVSRTSLLPVFGQHITTLSPNSKVDFEAPDLVVSVDVVKTVCCVSVVRDFHKFRKYNLQEVATLVHKRLHGDGNQTSEGKPDDSKTSEEQPDDGKTSETQPDDSETPETQPEDSKTSETQPDDSKTSETQPDDSKTTETQPDDSKTSETQPDDSKTSETQQDDSKTHETQPNGSKTSETQPDDCKTDI